MNDKEYFGRRIPFVQLVVGLLALVAVGALLFQQGALSAIVAAEVSSVTRAMLGFIGILMVVSLLQIARLTWSVQRYTGGYAVPLDYANDVQRALMWPDTVMHNSLLLGLMGTLFGIQQQFDTLNSGAAGLSAIATAFSCTLAGVGCSLVLAMARSNLEVALARAVRQ